MASTSYRREINLKDSSLENNSKKNLLEALQDKLSNKNDITNIEISQNEISFVYKVDGNVKFDCEIEVKMSDELAVFEGNISQEWTALAQFAICASFGTAVFYLMISQNKADNEDVKSVLDFAIRDIELGLE